MLNALLDINQIEAGAVRPEMALFPVNDLLVKLRDEFTYQAQAKTSRRCAWFAAACRFAAIRACSNR